MAKERPSRRLVSAPEPLAILRALKQPTLRPWQHLLEQAAPRGPGLRAAFLGVSTILLTDGESTILTDGFFSRPNLLRVGLRRLRPDRARIDAALRRFGIDQVDALFVVHSHFDHAMDAPIVADITGARLHGSESTRNIARGYGVANDRFDQLVTRQPISIGQFTVTALPAAHSPGDIAPGTIDQPLPPGRRARDYRTGECYSLHIRYGARQLLIHASANVLPGALDGYRADTVYLGIGALGKQDAEFREVYWRQLVRETGAQRVVPIHWDNFMTGLDRPLRPLPTIFDNFTDSMHFLSRRAVTDGVALALPRLGLRVDPFAH